MKIYSNGHATNLVNACVKQNIPALLRGETGTGKTTIVRALAHERGQHLTRINLTGQTTREDLIGKYILQEDNLVWQDGPLVTALKLGHWILLDEINAALPEVLFVIQALLESSGRLGDVLLVEKNGEVLRPHEQSRIFATCNPSDYEGVKDLNMATISRFVVIDIEPLDIATEEQLLLDRYKSPIARKLVSGAQSARKKKADGETMVFVSTRDLELAARLHQEGIQEDQAITVAILAKCQNNVDKEVIHKCFNTAVTPSKGKTFMEELEDLRKENEKLTKEAKSAGELLKLFKTVADKLK